MSISERRPYFFLSAPRCAADCSAGGASCVYQVAWSINPHMRVGSATPARALRQHAQFSRALRDAGATLEHVPFVHGAFDSVFMKDNALLVEGSGRRRALLMSPRHSERRKEQRERARALAERGFEVHAPPPAPLEGGDIAVLPDGGAILGYGFRSSLRARDALERFLDAPVLTLALRDPYLYHLDTALAVLDDGTIVACDEAFTPASRALLAAKAATAPGWIRLSTAEARHFATNLVDVRGTIFTASRSSRLHAALRRRGKTVKTCSLDEFHLAGGSAACLVARVHRLDVEQAERAARAA